MTKARYTDEQRAALKAARSDVARLKRKGLIGSNVDARKVKVTLDREAVRLMKREAASGNILDMPKFRIASRALRKRVAENRDVIDETTARVHGAPRVFKLTRKEAKALRERAASLRAEGRDAEAPRVVGNRLVVNADQTISRPKKGTAPVVRDRGFSRRKTIAVINSRGEYVPGWQDRLRAFFEGQEGVSASLLDNGASMMEQSFYYADDLIQYIEGRYIKHEDDDGKLHPLHITLWTMEERQKLFYRGYKPRNPRYADRPRTEGRKRNQSDRTRELTRLRVQRYRARHK